MWTVHFLMMVALFLLPSKTICRIAFLSQLPAAIQFFFCWLCCWTPSKFIAYNVTQSIPHSIISTSSFDRIFHTSALSRCQFIFHIRCIIHLMKWYSRSWGMLNEMLIFDCKFHWRWKCISVQFAQTCPFLSLWYSTRRVRYWTHWHIWFERNCSIRKIYGRQFIERNHECHFEVPKYRLCMIYSDMRRSTAKCHSSLFDYIIGSTFCLHPTCAFFSYIARSMNRTIYLLRRHLALFSNEQKKNIERCSGDKKCAMRQV